MQSIVAIINSETKRKGITLYSLAKQSGYTPTYLYQISKGLKSPTLETAQKILAALDVKIKYEVSDNGN